MAGDNQSTSDLLTAQQTGRRERFDGETREAVEFEKRRRFR
jgi:hypothetical protein